MKQISKKGIVAFQSYFYDGTYYQQGLRRLRKKEPISSPKEIFRAKYGVERLLFNRKQIIEILNTQAYPEVKKIFRDLARRRFTYNKLYRLKKKNKGYGPYSLIRPMTVVRPYFMVNSHEGELVHKYYKKPGDEPPGSFMRKMEFKFSLGRRIVSGNNYTLPINLEIENTSKHARYILDSTEFKSNMVPRDYFQEVAKRSQFVVRNIINQNKQFIVR